MRLCWNDGLGGPLKNMKLEEAKFIYNVGYRVAGINAGDTEAADADIERAKNILEETGLTPGPYGLSASAIHPDKAEQKIQKENY